MAEEEIPNLRRKPAADKISTDAVEDRNLSFMEKIKENTVLSLAIKLVSAVAALVSIVGALVAVEAYFLTKDEYKKFICLNNIELEAVRNDTLILTLTEEKAILNRSKIKLDRNKNRSTDEEVELTTKIDAIELIKDLITETTKSKTQREKDRQKCITDGE